MQFTNISECISFIESRRRFRPKTDLVNMIRLCELFGNPQEGQKYIHITGTNGKGSTSLFITNILMASGYKVGTFVSPYVTCFNERIEYNKNYITDEELLEITNLILSKSEYFDNEYILEPSFFEYCTLIAFLYYKKKKPDFVILEVGMGGTLDSTNIITPLVSVITNVAMDHMATLGSTIEEICMNKLGIVKEGKPLITFSDERLNHLFKEKTIQTNSPLHLIDKSNIENVRLNLTETVFDYKDYKNISLQMLGKYQTENATLALEVANYIESLGYIISKESIYGGLANTKWPGRLEVVSYSPIIILDGAHNVDGINRLREYIISIKQNKYLKIVFAVSSDKEKDGMIRLLEDVCDEIVFTKFQYKRSDDADYLYSLSNHKNKKILESTDLVYDEIISEKDKLIICCGSLYFVSEIRKKFKN